LNTYTVISGTNLDGRTWAICPDKSPVIIFSNDDARKELIESLDASEINQLGSNNVIFSLITINN
jgi:hypothetical protein